MTCTNLLLCNQYCTCQGKNTSPTSFSDSADRLQNEIRIVQASLLGSILANLLLIMGMAFLLGGLRFQEQVRLPMSIPD